MNLKDLMANQKNFLLALSTVSSLLNNDILNESISLNFEEIEGRFEIVNQNPVKIIDGAHNLDGVKHLFKDYERQYDFQQTDIFIGFKKGKDIESIISFINNNRFFMIFLYQGPPPPLC